MSNLRIKKKHLNPDAVDGSKLKLLAGESVRVVDGNGATVDLVKLDASGNVLGNGQELAKKSDLDNEVSSRQAAVSAEESARIAGDLNEQSSRVAAIEAETSARIAGDASLQSELDSEQSARIAAVLSEESARIAADSTLQSALDAEISSRQAAVSAEESRAVAAEAALQAAIDAESSSRQQAIADLVNSAPAVLDTLKELADALGGDDNFATTISNRFSSIESSLSAATQDGTEYTDEKYQDILDLISQTLLKKELVAITAQNVSDGYVVLSGTSIIPRSMSGSIDRLSIFEDEDFSLSVVGGATRLTFLNSFAPNGDEGVEEGEQLRLTYWSLS